MRARRTAREQQQQQQPDQGERPAPRAAGRPRHSSEPGPDTRSVILDHAEALLGEQGFLGLSMQGLARSSGHSVGTLYYHFPGGKEALTLAVAERLLESLGAGIAQALSAGEDVRARLEGVARWILASRRHTERVLRDTRRFLPPEHTQLTDARFMGQVFAPLERLLHGSVEQGVLLPHDTAFRAWAFLGLLQEFAELSGVMPMPGVAEKIVEMVLGGLERAGGSP